MPPNWLRYKNTTINLKNIDVSCFQYAFALTQHHKEIKSHLEQVSNIKPFLYLYTWAGIECPASMNKNSYTLFEKKP